MIKAKELRKKSTKELLNMRNDLKMQNIRNRGLLRHMGYDPKSKFRLKETRREIARINSVLAERGIKDETSLQL